jgi:hypothetical protein
MNSKLLKLDSPYQIIYAGGKIGRHIATLITWEDPEDKSLTIPYSVCYPVIDQGNDVPSGLLVTEAKLEDCQVVFREESPYVKLRDFARLVKFDFEQPEPTSAGHLWKCLSNLGAKIDPDKIRGITNRDEENIRTDYHVSLSFSGSGDHYRVESDESGGFYFYATGSLEEVYQQLDYQKSIYESMFRPLALQIHLSILDGTDEEKDLVERLNHPMMDI